MTTESVATALEREHHEIDDGIETFTASVAAGDYRLEPLLRTLNALRRHIYLDERFPFPALRARPPASWSSNCNTTTSRRRGSSTHRRTRWWANRRTPS